MRLAIIGAGSWGTALAIALAPRAETTTLWVYEEDLAAQMSATRINPTFLPGFRVPESVTITTDLKTAVAKADIVLSVVPSEHVRRIYTAMRPHLNPGVIFVSATKGLEQGSLLRMSQVIDTVLRDPAGPHPFEPRVTVLSGPTFAKEIAKGDPAAVVVASYDSEAATLVQKEFSSTTLRLYANFDPVGVELAVALKNVVAIGAGICAGLGLGSNTQAALVTRGLAEMTRLAVALGGKPKTMSGLAGLGDLVLTCTGQLSRNRTVGLELAAGKSLAEITRSMKMVAEGVKTCSAAVDLAHKHKIELPITTQMQAVLSGEASPPDAIRVLMRRSLKTE